MTVSRRRHISPRLSRDQVEALLGDGDIADDAPPLPDLARMARRMEAKAMQWDLLVAFLQQKGVIVARVGTTVDVGFGSYVAADQFEKFLRQAMKART